MDIDKKFHGEIKNLNVNEFLVSCDYSYWDDEFKDNEQVNGRLNLVKERLGIKFGRKEIIGFYKTDVDLETKFLAAMIWGHEAPENSRRDTRGPYKVREMFASDTFSSTLRDVRSETYNDISRSYSKIKRNIKWCGPSFLTKHLYFLGKSKNTDTYPLILDNRVSVGLVKINLSNVGCLKFVTIQAESKVKAYIDFLKFAKAQSTLIGCELDQIEYFLFKHAE
jgi:hypothetical protein